MTPPLPIQVGVYVVDRQGDYYHHPTCFKEPVGTPVYAHEVAWEDKCETCGKPLIQGLEAHLAKSEADLMAYIQANTDLPTFLRYLFHLTQRDE